ncbi:MAG: RHS repeat-associated core domain-containing protein [Bdellovibrionales bacterium]
MNVGTGNKYQVEADYEGPAYTGVELIRYYNSQDSRISQFGANWRSTWDRALELTDDKTVKAIRANGRVYSFTQSGSGWSAAPGVTLTLSGSATSGFTLVDDDDNTETYSAKGQLQTIKTRAGEVTQLQYHNAGDKLSSARGPYGHTLTFHHDANGFVDSVTQADGKVVKYSVDGNKNLAKVTYADDATRTYVYNESANTSGASLPHALTGIIDGNGARFATYQYNADNKAISTEHAGGVEKVTVAYNADGTATVTDALGNVHGYDFTTNNNIVLPTAVTGAPVANIGAKAMTYDQYGFVATRTDYNDNVTRYTHSPRGQELTRTEAAGTPLARTFTTTWHPKFNLPTQFTEPSGVPGVNRVTTWTYNDANGALLSKTTAAGGQSRSWTYADHDEYGHPGKITGPLGDVTTITYSGGAPFKITNALGHSYGFTNDGAGRPSSVCDPNNLCVRKTYTPHGEVETRSVNLQTTQYDYDKAHVLNGVTTPDGAHYTLQNDAAHQLAAIIDPLGNRMQLGRDLNGNVKTEQVFDTAGTLVRTRSHNYDAVNRLAQDIGAKGQTTTYGRDGNGEIISATDPVGNVTTYGRDALRRVHTITAPDGGVTVIDYNPDDSIAVITDAKNNQTQYAYDGLGNQTEENSPDRGKITRTFDPAGNVWTETDGRGFTTTYERDILGRVKVAQYGDGTSVKYTYDTSPTNASQIGRLTVVEDSSGKTYLDHDKHGNVILKKQELNGVTLVTRHDFDDKTGQLDSTLLPSGKAVEYGYNAKSGKLETIEVSGKQLIGGIAYFPFSDAPEKWSQGDGHVNLYHLREQDQDGNLSKIVFGQPGANGGWNGQRILYGYDAASRLLCANNNDYHDTCMTYEHHRLKSFQSQVPQITDGVYAYDANGNRTWSTDARGDRDYRVSAFSNQLDGIKQGSTTQGFMYDNGGNLESDGKFTYTFGADGKLAKVVGAGVTVENATNGLGERVKKTANGAAKYFAQAGAQVSGVYTGMVAGTGNAVAEQETIFLAGMPVGVVTPTGRAFVNPGRQGEPYAIITESGQNVLQWDHAPFGDTEPVENGLKFDLRLPGQYYDAETGLLYNNNRIYNPQIGSYISSDPIGLAGGMNTYSYVGGDPANAVDPWGLEAGTNTSNTTLPVSSATDSASISNWFTNFLPTLLDISRRVPPGLGDAPKKINLWVNQIIGPANAVCMNPNGTAWGTQASDANSPLRVPPSGDIGDFANHAADNAPKLPEISGPSAPEWYTWLNRKLNPTLTP